MPPDVSPFTDAKALLSFAWKGGFVVGAPWSGLARTAFSEYRKLRDELGLAQYGEAEMIEILREPAFRPKGAARTSATTRRG